MAIDETKFSVREGLIKIVSAEMFRSVPHTGGETHVVVMERSGKGQRHYCTLRSANDRLSVGEQFWGNYVCYIVDMSLRKLKIESEYATQDLVTNIHVAVEITYRALDGDRVVLAVDDPLQFMRDEISRQLKRQIQRSPADQITEEKLEGLLTQGAVDQQNLWGLVVNQIRVVVSWSKEMLARRKEALEQMQRQREEQQKRRIEWAQQDEKRSRDWHVEDGDRKHEWHKQDEDKLREDQERIRQERIADRQRKLQQFQEDDDRERERNIDKEKKARINEIINQLGLDIMPLDVRLRLYAMPEEQALKEIIQWIETQRSRQLELIERRMSEEFQQIQQMRKDNILESQDMVEFGKKLLDRYQNMSSYQEIMSTYPALGLSGAQSKKDALPEPNKYQAMDDEHAKDVEDRDRPQPASPSPSTSVNKEEKPDSDDFDESHPLPDNKE